MLTGAAGNFSSGMDLKAFATGETPLLPGRGLCGIAERAPAKPLIAAVEGYALAGGFEVALACDLIVASRDGGLRPARGASRPASPQGGGLVRLPRESRRCGSPHELILTGDFFSAEPNGPSNGVVSREAEPVEPFDAVREPARGGSPPTRSFRSPAPRPLLLQLSADLGEAELWEPSPR